MASYGTLQRPSITTTATSTTAHPHEQEDSSQKNRNEFKLLIPFNIPITTEAAAVRIIRNLGHLRLYYTLFIWTVLFITLAPKRKVSLVYLVAMTVVSCWYLLLLRAVPKSVVLHQIIDRRLVLALLAIVTMIELILTDAAIHLFLTLGCGSLVVLVHAVFWVRDDLFVEEEASAAGELVPLRIAVTEPELSDSV